MILSKKFLPVIFPSFPNREESQGTMVKEESKENKVARITVTQNWEIKSETNPVLIAIGRNTTTITRVIAETVNPISIIPS